MVSVNKIGIFLSFFSVQIIEQVYGDATDIGRNFVAHGKILAKPVI